MNNLYFYADNRYDLRNQSPYPLALGPKFHPILESLTVGTPVVAVYSFPLNLEDIAFIGLHAELDKVEEMVWSLKKKCPIKAVLLDFEAWKVARLPDGGRRFEILTIQNRLYSIFYGVTYDVMTKRRAPIYWYRYGDSDHFIPAMTLGEISVRGYTYNEVERAVNNPQVKHIYLSLGFDYVLRNELPAWVPETWTGYKWSSKISTDPAIQQRINELDMWQERAKMKALLVKNWPYDVTVYPNPVYAPKAFEAFKEILSNVSN